MNRRIPILSIAAPALMAGVLAAQDPAPQEKPPARPGSSERMSAPSKSSELSAFAKKAAAGGLAEVELGRLAADKASNDRVKQFAQRMVDDHSRANDELKQAASAENVDLPTAVDAKHQATIDKLSKLSGPAFDKAYMDDMVQDHVKDVAEFEKASKSGGSSSIRSFAEKTLPTLKEHLRMAREVHREVGAKAGAPSKSSSR